MLPALILVCPRSLLDILAGTLMKDGTDGGCRKVSVSPGSGGGVFDVFQKYYFHHPRANRTSNSLRSWTRGGVYTGTANRRTRRFIRLSSWLSSSSRVLRALSPKPSHRCCCNIGVVNSTPDTRKSGTSKFQKVSGHLQLPL